MPISPLDDLLYGSRALPIQKMREADHALFMAQIKNVEAESLDAIANEIGQLEYPAVDGEGNLRMIMSALDLFERFGIHAHFAGFNTKGVVQFYVSADDGRIYGVITMDEIKYLLEALVSANGEQRFFKVGTRNNGSAPEGVIDFGKPVSSVSLADPDFDNGLDEWNVLSQAYTKQVINSSLPAKIITCMCMDGSGNIYVGLSDGGSGATSAVWKLPVGTTTWQALGTLNTGFNILAIACDSHGNVFVGGDDLTTSAVWKCAVGGSTWAAHGTLTATFDVYSLVVDSNDRLYAGTNNGTTSRVWYVDDGSTTWAALGTLTSLEVYAMVKDDSNNIYAVGDGSATSSAWWWNGSTWAALGTLNIANSYVGVDIDLTTGYLYAIGGISDLVYWNGSVWTQINDSLFYSSANNSFGVSVAFINNTIVIGRRTANGSIEDSYGALIGIDVTGNYKKIDFDFVTGNSVYAILKNGNDFYVGGGTSLDVVKFTLTDSWSAEEGFAEITIQELDAAIVLGTRWAVVAGNFLEVKAANYLEAVGGIANAVCKIEFWDAATGGTLIGSEEVFNRSIDDAVGALSELSDIVQVPVGATYAVLVASVALDTATEATVKFDDFQVDVVSNFLRFKLTDEGLYAEKDGKEYDLLNGNVLESLSDNVTVVSTNIETTLASISVDGGLLGSKDVVEIEFWGMYFNNSGATRTITLRCNYGNGTAIDILVQSIGAGTTEHLIYGKVVVKANNATNAQRLNSVVTRSPNDGVLASASVLASREGTFNRDSTNSQSLKITAQHSAANANLSFILRRAKFTHYKDTSPS